MHHAKANNAEGFCFINDIVLCICQLLMKGFWRVLYIDIDIHHGDGVEEAFYTSDRVFTLSLHKENFFPYTGNIECIGLEEGRGYSANVNLLEGVDDDTFVYIFE